ncbi:MAG TPA: hypothetical protein VFR67_27420 [Pilimelia sp.]|nr:hypothetical protein [Pilimelia sp.]
MAVLVAARGHAARVDPAAHGVCAHPEQIRGFTDPKHRHTRNTTALHLRGEVSILARTYRAVAHHDAASASWKDDREAGHDDHRLRTPLVHGPDPPGRRRPVRCPPPSSSTGVGASAALFTDRLAAAPIDTWYCAETQAFRATRAATWDTKFGDDLPAYIAAVTEAGIAPGGTVLDVGCGTGWHLTTYDDPPHRFLAIATRAAAPTPPGRGRHEG